MKNLIIPFILIITFTNANAQDIIYTINNIKIEAKIIQISDFEVVYKKYNNLNGPNYILKKEIIARIEYENGTSESFESLDYNYRKEYPKIDSLSSYKAYSKNKNVSFDYRFNIEKVFNTDEIHYFGIDFSNFTLLNKKKDGQEDIIKKYIPAWVSHFEKKKPDYILLEDILEFNKTIVDKRISKHRNNKFDLDGRVLWINSSAPPLSIESVVHITQHYSNQNSDNKDVGLIIVVDSFDKEKELATIIYNFFNMKDGSLLWSTKINYRVNGKGMTVHWAVGLINCTNVYGSIYRKEKKNYKKSHK